MAGSFLLLLFGGVSMVGGIIKIIGIRAAPGEHALKKSFEGFMVFSAHSLSYFSHRTLHFVRFRPLMGFSADQYC